MLGLRVQLLRYASKLVRLTATQQFHHFFQHFVRRKVLCANEDASSQVAQHIREMAFNAVNLTISLKYLGERPVSRCEMLAIKIVHTITFGC